MISRKLSIYPHLEVKTCIFVEMAFGIVFFRAENRSGLKYPVKYPHHHLFVKLRTLGENRAVCESS